MAYSFTEILNKKWLEKAADDIAKYNDRHDELGRFAPKNGGAGSSAELKPIKHDPRWAYQPDEETDLSDMVENPIPFVGVGTDMDLAVKFEDETRQPEYISNTEVNISELKTLQPFVLRSGIEDYKPWDDSERPYVIEFEGQKYVIDGNHRIARAKLNGETTVRVDVSVRELRVSKSFNEILNRKILEKFNPYHDRLGRFASADGAASMTIATRDPKKQHLADMAMEREKEKHTAKLLAPTEAQEKELTRIANRTRNLKKEQLRVVDAEGNVVLEKKGDRGEVTFTVGEARDNFNGNIVIHNHPDGGTFSSPDLRTLGYGAKEIRVAAPEGDYLMKAAKTTKSGRPDTSGWLDLQEKLETDQESFKSYRNLKSQVNKQFEPDHKEKVLVHAEKWLKAKESGASMEEQQKHIDAYNKANEAWQAENKPKIEAEARRLMVQQYHDFYTANASKYGLEYTFTPKSVKKSMENDMEEIDDITKSGEGDIVLDGDRNRKILQITEEIITEMGGDLAKQINAR